MNLYTKEQLIDELRKVFNKLGRAYSRTEFSEHSCIARSTIESRFGSWSKAMEEAGFVSKFNPTKEVEKKWKQDREKLLYDAEKKKVKEVSNVENKFQLLGDMIKDSVSQLPQPIIKVQPLKIIKKNINEKRNCVLWAEFSDLQLGTYMSKEEMGGLNEHNWNIWLKKLKIWKENVIEKISYYSESYIIDKIVIAGLGDFVEGIQIFKGQKWNVDSNVVDQAINGASDTAEAFAEIFLTFPELEFHLLEVFGNHGRVGEKGENPYGCSFDKVYMRFLEARLQTIPEIKNLTYHKNESWWYLVEIYGWNHLILHGDQGMSGLWSSKPTMNSLEKGIVRYNQMLQQQIHFLHVGHFHQDLQISFNMSQILINGSFVGTSNFSASQMVASSPPVQIMHVFTPRVGLERTERIHLVEGDVKNPMPPTKII